MKQPLVTVASVYGSGIVLGYFLEPLLFPTLSVAFVICAMTLVFRGSRPLLLSFTLFLFGWANMGARMAELSPWDVRSIWQNEEKTVDLRATITTAPSHRILLRNDVETSRTLVELDILAIRRRNGGWEPAFGRVMATTTGILPSDFCVGQSIEVGGIVRPPSTPLARGLFNYRQHLNSQGIYYELKVDSPRHWKLAGPSAPAPLAERFRNWAQRTLSRGLPVQDEALRLQWAMLLGWKTALTSEVSEPFMRSGTMHIFAISGLHIAMIAGICLAMVRAIALPRIACGLIVLPVIWFYTCATGWQPSAIRATVMMTVIILGWAFNRPPELLNSLATAACIILVWQPQQLFQPGFQLSFFVVFSIALLSPSIDSLKKRAFAPDSLLPNQLRPFWQRVAIRGADFVWTSCAVSIAAFIGSIPLIAHYFHLFTPGSVIANLVIVPVSSLALMSGIGSLITGDLFPLLTEWFNHSGWFWMRIMIWMSEIAADLPGAWWHTSSPGVPLVCVYYGLLAGLCAGWFRRTILRGTMITGTSIIIVHHAMQWLEHRTWHRITIFPFNRAQAIYVEPGRGGRPWLLNCGDKGAVDFTLKPFLQSKGTDRLEHLILTHGDTRYMGGALQLHETFPLRRVHTSPISFRSPRYREALIKFREDLVSETSLTNGWCSPPWTILHPSISDRFALAKDNAIVALGDFDGTRVLILPPLGRAAQNCIYGRYPDLQADIVIAVAGEGSEIAPQWLEKLRPKLLLFVSSASASEKTIAMPRADGLKLPTIHVGRETGAATISLRKREWQTETARFMTGLE